MSNFTLSDLLRLSKLSQIKLSEKELDKFSTQISEILNFISQLSNINTQEVSPQTHSTGRKNVFREDEVKPSLTQEEALKNAPATYKGFFKVRAIFTEETQK